MVYRRKGSRREVHRAVFRGIYLIENAIEVDEIPSLDYAYLLMYKYGVNSAHEVS